MALPLPVSCIFLVSVFASVESQAGTPHLLECKICRNAISIKECREIQRCARNEECYMESILTPQMQTVFNGGCRSTRVCNTGADHTGKRAVTDHVICSACCNTTRSPTTMECNANLCGINSSLLIPQKKCYYCGEGSDAMQGAVTDPRKCREITFCEDDEVCRTTVKNTAGVLTYEFGCQQLLQCQLITLVTLEQIGVKIHVDIQHLSETGELLIGRKRQLALCDICCGDGLCNDDVCTSVRARIAEFAKQGRFNYTTLTMIR